MNEPIYVFQCPSCDQFTNGTVLACGSCGESVKRSWVETITDGAPVGDTDPAEARGFRAGQEHGIAIERERIVALLEQYIYKYNDEFDMVLLGKQHLINKAKGQL